ncbi:MAG: hypothetical protein JSS30_02580 [Verrucomicrobia bacterium]|nr:hypothetical protein [Verrucomicrobiota bacterium]
MSAAEIKAFSPHLFNHHVGLERQLNGKEEISVIESAAVNPDPGPASRYFSRWQVVWIIVKHPFELVASIFFKALSFLCNQLAFQKGVRIFSVLSKQMTRDWKQVCLQWHFNLKEDEASSELLTPAFNVHQTASWDVYTHGSIAQSFLIDKDVIAMTSHYANYQKGIKQALGVFFQQVEKIKAKEKKWYNFWDPVEIPALEKKRIRKIFADKYLHSSTEAIRFLKHAFPEIAKETAISQIYDVLKQMDAYLQQNCREIRLYSDGLCRGASLWFINLYLKTAAKFSDPVKHLRAVSEQFTMGVPKQGAILQGLETTDRLLKVEMQRLKQHDISLYELECNLKRALKKVESLEKGIYRLGVLNHSLVYIKTETGSYIWDPEIGLLAMSDKQLLSYIMRRYYQLGNTQSRIYFEQYQSL